MWNCLVAPRILSFEAPSIRAHSRLFVVEQGQTANSRARSVPKTKISSAALGEEEEHKEGDEMRTSWPSLTRKPGTRDHGLPCLGIPKWYLMSDEAEAGFARAPDSGGYPQGSGKIRSPLQARAPFFKNWDWQSVVSINRGACAQEERHSTELVRKLEERARKSGKKSAYKA